jgi:hypothetical protein
MSKPYEEMVEGDRLLRPRPDTRHEDICARLHARVAAALAGNAAIRLLEPRDSVQLSPYTTVRPDLTLVTAANGKAFLLAEIIGSEDHRWDTVVKKQVYEELRIPRLWMVDPRYNNVEVYHGTSFGLSLKGILAGREVVTEKLLPDFQMTIAEVFDLALREREKE